MSDVIRNAVIKLAIQLQQPDLNTSAIDEATRAQERLTTATEQQTAVGKAAEAVHVKQTAATEALSAATEAATVKVESVAGAIAAESAAASASTAANTAAAGGMAALETAVGTLAAPFAALLLAVNFISEAYDRLTTSAEEASAAQRKLNEENERGAESLNKLAGYELKKIDLLKDATQKEKALQNVLRQPVDSASFGDKSKVPAAQELLKMYEERRKAAEKERKSQIDAVKLSEKELEQARARLDIAQRSMSKAEASRVDRAYHRTHDKEGHERRDKGASYESELGKVLGQQRAEMLRAAQESFEKSQAKFNKITGGKSSGEAIASINSAEDEIVRGIDQLSDGVATKLKQVYDRLSAIELEVDQQRQAAQTRKAMSVFGRVH